MTYSSVNLDAAGTSATSGKVLIYGNGSMARVLFSYVKRNMEVCGFTVDDNCIAKNSPTFCGRPLVPFSRVQEVFDPKVCEMIIAIGFVDMNELREKKYLEAKEKGYVFTSYVHDSVLLHDDVLIGENCVILDHVSIHPDCEIRKGTWITSNVSIGHTCMIGAFNWINSGVSIGGGCHIGPGCFFGVNSSVGHGVNVGAQNFVAANTLLTRDTKDNEVYISEAGQLFRLKSKSFLKFSGVLE